MLEIHKKPPRSYWVVGIVALTWNLLGMTTYLMSVSTSEGSLAALSESERALNMAIPWWVMGAYAIAVFAGLLGSVALLTKRASAVPLFLLSLFAILVQQTYTLFLGDHLEVYGATGAILPITIIVAAIGLAWYAVYSSKRGYL